MYIAFIKLPEEVQGTKSLLFTDCFPDINIIEHSKSIKDLEIKVDDTHYRNCYEIVLSESEICNFITHRNIWIDFLKNKNKWALIIENNINQSFILSEIQRTIQELYSMNNDWDVYFPYDLPNIREKYFLSKTGKNLINYNPQEIVKRHLYYINFKWGNSIYIISRKGAQKLLSISTINDRLDNTILRLSSDDKLNLYYENVNWFDYNNIIPFEWTQRCELILRNALKTFSWNKDRLSRAREILKKLSSIGIENDISLLLQGGSHLGYIRHGGIMPWDDDIDIGIEESKINLFIKKLKEHNEFCIDKHIESRTNTPYYKIWKKNGESIEGYDYTFPFIDLWLYSRIGSDIIFKNGIICPNSSIQNFIDVVFEGSIFQIVSNSLEVLDSRYSDWRNHIHIYCYSHRLETSVRHFICIPIQTNENGRSAFPKNISEYMY